MFDYALAPYNTNSVILNVAITPALVFVESDIEYRAPTSHRMTLAWFIFECTTFQLKKVKFQNSSSVIR